MGDLSIDINSKFENEKQKALINIMYTANWINSFQNEFFKSFGISPQQYNILKILNGASEPLKVQTIKDRMIERSPNATRLMDKLCSKHLIDRIPCEDDRRVVHIAITSQGKTLLEAISSDFYENLVEKLSETEAQQLNQILDKMR
ncbi:MarR family winged helix-turn-helix transcriptional regulator [Paucihalobacter sp.]|uniref:MarR family winged helix-turn-helix transcriptional regulator n=1 Tax=Paucihalobacter sp. TaxID=2850405 RepID=UPI002FE3969E